MPGLPPETNIRPRINALRALLYAVLAVVAVTVAALILA